MTKLPEYRTLTGEGNNEEQTGFGSTGSQLIRVGEARYLDDGSSLDDAELPNPRDVSNTVVKQDAELETQNDNHVTNLFTFWGQFLDHDLSFSLDNGDPMNIPVAEGDSLGVPEIFVNRSEIDPDTGTGADNPRQQLTAVTSFIDASMVYGSDEAKAAELRGHCGKLKVSEGNMLPLNDGSQEKLPADPADSFVAGDLRANENFALTSLHTLFVREHNRLVEELAEKHPKWSSETLYQEAKAINEALIQHITYDEFVPMLLGEDALPEYDGYKEDVDPGISQLFSTAAFRVGHTLLPATLSLRDADGNVTDEIALRDAFFRPASEFTGELMDQLLRGLATDKAQNVDNMVVDEVREFLIGEGFGTLGFDLPALNLQRGRDHGLPLFNDAREAVGLERYDSFDDITADPEVQEKLASVYDSVDEVEAWMGGISEDKVDGAMVGEFFYTVLADQFQRSRDGDRFYYEGRLHEDVVQEVKDTSLAEIVERNTGVSEMQDFAFVNDEAPTAEADMLLS